MRDTQFTFELMAVTMGSMIVFIGALALVVTAGIKLVQKLRKGK